MARKSKKVGALVLFSGGLDSTLVVKVLQEQGIRVETVHFTCPFYSSEWARRNARAIGIKLHEVPVDKTYFELVAKPKHGYGSQANHCIDCKVYMLKRAERLRGRLNSARRSLRERTERLDFLATGEVLGERPFSQRRPRLMLIESEAGLVGKVLRPLSAKLLSPTLAETRGLVKRNRLLAIRGRSRRPQMALAKKYGIKYPAPAGGCLLTDPGYSRKIREHLKHKGSISWNDAELLKHGRHFRLFGARIVVGRNEEENNALLGLAKKMGLIRLEALGYPGPITVIESEESPKEKVIEVAAMLTVRYSDAPRKAMVEVEVIKAGKRRILEAKAVSRRELDRIRI